LGRAGRAPYRHGEFMQNSRPVSTSPSIFDDSMPIPTPRYRRDDLRPGGTINGPAVIEDAHSTVVIPPGAKLTVDANRHMRIATGP
jgi:N-methylhydantoinase A/oxoprolinase/acetone carboxylase beta subunit